MIFFAAMPMVIGLMNFVVPLQLGVRDVAFPTFNSVSFWLTATGALLVNMSLFVGEFARTGWLPYPPLSEGAYSPGVGVDYYLWAIQISGMGTLITGVNFVTTILKMRCPGMSYLRMPMFTWTALASSLLIVAAFPILTATLAMLTLDRYFGFHFFTNTAGGNPMMFMNLIWAWGHPEVYILVLPAFGVFSEVFSTFSGKPLFGYRSMVAATMFICIVSMLVWLHHFFTMGAGGDVNTFFGISTSIIAVGTGVKVYNWIFTMYGGRVRFTAAMYWSLGFIFTFVLGGVTGVLMAVPPADFLVHNSMFLVAHFHNTIVGGVVFGLFAALHYWFPKAFGFRLHEGWGKAAFWFAFVGFLGDLHPALLARAPGHDAPAAAHRRGGLATLAAGLAVRGGTDRGERALPDHHAGHQHPRSREAARCDGRSVGRPLARMGDPLAGPVLQLRRAAERGRRGSLLGHQAAGDRTPRAWIPEPRYRPIHMPKNSPVGFITAFFATMVGFSLIWHIWWLAGVGRCAPTPASSSSPGATRMSSRCRWRRWPASTAPAAPPARPCSNGWAERGAPPDVQRRTRVPRHPGGDPARPLRSSQARTSGARAPLRSRDADTARLARRAPGSSSPMASGSSCSPTSSSSPASSPPSPCCTETPRAGPRRATWSSLAGWRWKRRPCSCRASPAACPTRPPTRRAGSGRRSSWGSPACSGLVFLGLELSEFIGLAARGATPQRSGFLTAFFALVGCHGLHVTVGLLWLATMMAQLLVKGFRPEIVNRLVCFNLFWHALDIIWVALFSVVYLMGALP